MAIEGQAIFDLIDRIALASSQEELWRTYLAATEDLGLSCGYLGFLPYLDGQPPDIADGAPSSFVQGYRDNALREGDLVLSAARTSSNSFAWTLSDWTADRMTPVQRRWRDHCHMFSIEGGFCILHFAQDMKVALSVCGRPGSLSEHDRTAMKFVGQELIIRLNQFVGEIQTGGVWLSRREKECLEWAAAGKTDWEIGQILSLNEKTVNVYINRAKLKFGVKSRAQAIVRASRSGLIAH